MVLLDAPLLEEPLDPLLENLWESNLDMSPLEDIVNCCDPPSLKEVLKSLSPL